MPSPAEERHCWHTLPCRWAPGGLERHPIAQDPSLRVGHCDLNPKQLLSPSAVSLCHGRGHLPRLVTPPGFTRDIHTLDLTMGKIWGWGAPTYNQSAAFGVPDTSKGSEGLFPGLLPLSMAAVLQGQAPGSCSPSTPYPSRQPPGWNIPASPAPPFPGEGTWVLSSCSPSIPIPWGRHLGAIFLFPQHPNPLGMGSKCRVPAPPAPPSLGDGIQVPFSCSLSTSTLWNRHPGALPPKSRHHPLG